MSMVARSIIPVGGIEVPVVHCFSTGGRQGSQDPDEASLDEMSPDAEDNVYGALIEVFGPQPWHGEAEDGLTPDLWERAAMEWERLHRECSSPPRSILGDESWDEEDDKAFQEIKNVLCSQFILQRVNPDRQFVLRVDASKVAVGETLEQLLE